MLCLYVAGSIFKFLLKRGVYLWELKMQYLNVTGTIS